MLSVSIAKYNEQLKSYNNICFSSTFRFRVNANVEFFVAKTIRLEVKCKIYIKLHQSLSNIWSSVAFTSNFIFLCNCVNLYKTKLTIPKN